MRLNSLWRFKLCFFSYKLEELSQIFLLPDDPDDCNVDCIIIESVKWHSSQGRSTKFLECMRQTMLELVVFF